MLGSMSTSPDKSRQVSPVAALFLGIAVFALDGFFLWRAIAGLEAGKIQTIGRGSHTFIVQQDSPGLFWLWVGFHFLLVIVTLVVAISLIRFWFRKDRR